MCIRDRPIETIGNNKIQSSVEDQAENLVLMKLFSYTPCYSDGPVTVFISCRETKKISAHFILVTAKQNLVFSFLT